MPKIIKSIKYFAIATLFTSTLLLPLVLVSCSNNKQPEVSGKTTTLLTSGTLLDGNQLREIYPDDVINLAEALREYVYDNLITGTKENINKNNIIFLAKDITSNNTNGSIVIKYTINAYWSNNQYVTDVPKNITVTIFGFKIKITPTIFPSPIVGDTNVNNELAQYDVLAIKDKTTILKQWLLDTQISGNKYTLTESDITIISIDDIELSLAKFSISYKLTRFYNSNELLIADSDIFTISLIGFKPITNPDDAQLLSLISSGGTSEALIYSSYMTVLKTANLSKLSRLDKISNVSINAAIQKIHDFRDLQAAIINGNQSLGEIQISLSGIYKTATIPANTIIKITGFNKTVADYNILSNLKIQQMHIDFDRYFNDLQDTTNMKAWTPEQWFNKYLNKLSVVRFPASSVHIEFDALEYYRLGLLKSVSFSNLNDLIDNPKLNYKKFGMNFDYQNYKYADGIWVVDGSPITFSYSLISDASFIKPSNQDALQYIATNKMIANQANIASVYASSAYASILADGVAIDAYYSFNKDYSNKYFNSQNMIVVADDNSITPNDTDGSLSILYHLELPDSLDVLINSGFTKLAGFKTISNYFTDRQNTADNQLKNFANIKRDTTAFNRMKNIIKSVFKTDEELLALKVNEPVVIDASPTYFLASSTFGFIYDSNQPNDDTKYFANLFENIADFVWLNYSINRQLITASTNILRQGNEKFFIQNIRYEFDPTIKATLTKTNDNRFEYRLPFKYTTSLFINDGIVETDTYMVAQFLMSDLKH